MAHSDMSACVFEGLPLLRCKFADVGVDVFYIVIFRDQLASSDLSDAFHARHIVG